jgi:hypothetical protein
MPTEARRRRSQLNPQVPVVQAPSTARRAWIIAATVLLAWFGLIIHNRMEFPLMAFTRPEYIVPTLAWLVVFLVWLRFPNHQLARKLLLGWGMISLAGAIVTVLPLPFLPFSPEQSLSHYVVHALNALGQLPVIWLTRTMR